MKFATEITLTGPFRAPAQMLADQEYDGHASVHDDATAASLGLAGAPIEGPTHFSQIDPLGVAWFGEEWFATGCISAHFQTMVVEGELVRATLTARGYDDVARIEAHKQDGTPVLTGTASLGPAYGPTALDERLARMSEPGDLYVIDQLEVGAKQTTPKPVRITPDEPNGASYPFSLADKLAKITEPHPWYTEEGSEYSAMGGPIVPMEMISVLAHKAGPSWPIRTPSLGLFLDLEVRLLDGPVLVDRDYRLEHEIVGLSQSRRTESYWTRTSVIDAANGRTTASVLLHSGVFKESYPGYPKN